MSAKILEAIVIYNQDYKENDSIVKVISRNKVITFLAQGTQKPLSKNRTSLMLLTYGEYEIFLARLNNKMSKLKKGTIIQQINFELLSQIFLELKDILFYLSFISTSNSKFFNHLISFIQNVNKYNYFVAKTFILFHLLELFGYKQVTDKCLECFSNKNLKTFSVAKGGFLCYLHSKKENIKTLEELKTFYYLNFDINLYLKFATPSANFKIYKEIQEFLNENVAYFK
ncbi:DNA repair protein RecO [Mesomycoplasma neurolyticum]|uniref:Recombinational DNA repair protein O n=1 Tax=Mesomycoplasma neurolyticum TaxID=2120 RepID=A0A449A5T1_9BACT|nr:DNA repair protein RecO [Mesomycoplasma neurolyticum]VEU59584.1 recombinational DNA repair protein O [Mesomycoplasma neurolyticum]